MALLETVVQENPDPMQTAQDQVQNFMTQAGQLCPPVPTIPNTDLRIFRMKLILEEACEIADALGVKLHVEPKAEHGHSFNTWIDPLRCPFDFTEVYDGLLDLLFVTIGSASAFGLKVKPGWEEVVRSNESKFIDGHLRPDGKFIKGPSWSPPNLDPIIERMGQPDYDFGKPTEGQIVARTTTKDQHSIPLTALPAILQSAMEIAIKGWRDTKIEDLKAMQVGIRNIGLDIADIEINAIETAIFILKQDAL